MQPVPTVGAADKEGEGGTSCPLETRQADGSGYTKLPDRDQDSDDRPQPPIEKNTHPANAEACITSGNKPPPKGILKQGKSKGGGGSGGSSGGAAGANSWTKGKGKSVEGEGKGTFARLLTSDPIAQDAFADEGVPTELTTCRGHVTYQGVVRAVACLDLVLIGLWALLVARLDIQDSRALLTHLAVTGVNIPFALCGAVATRAQSICLLAAYVVWRALWFVIWIAFLLILWSRLYQHLWGGEVSAVVDRGTRRTALSLAVMVVFTMAGAGIMYFQVWFFRVMTDYYKHMDIFGRQKTVGAIMGRRYPAGDRPDPPTVHEHMLMRLRELLHPDPEPAARGPDSTTPAAGEAEPLEMKLRQSRSGSYTVVDVNDTAGSSAEDSDEDDEEAGARVRVGSTSSAGGGGDGPSSPGPSGTARNKQ